MKKTLLLLFTALTILLNSCNENITSKKLIGQWKVIDANFKWEGASQQVLNSMVEDAKNQTYYINEDNSIKIDFGNGPKGISKWSFDGKRSLFIITTDGLSNKNLNQERYKIVNFENDKMTFRGLGPGQSIELHFAKISD